MTAVARDVTKYASDLKEFDSIDALLRSDESASGLYSIRHRPDVYTDVLFWNQRSNVTIVCFNGAGAPSKGVRPGFNGTSMFNSWKLANKANFVFVHDATLYLDENLRLAWYAGASEFNYADHLEQILRNFITATNPDHVVFFGISGGGHAALNYSTRFPGSIAVAGNPQTDIDEYDSPFRDNYYKSCWPKSVSPAQEKQNQPIFDLNAKYAEGTDNLAYCLVNINDRHHVEQHLVPFVEAANKHLNVRTLVHHWGTGHTAPSPQFLLEFFEELVSRLKLGEFFPAVKKSRLFESKHDVYAACKYEKSPREHELFTGLLYGVPQVAFSLQSGATETLEVRANVEFESECPVHGQVEFILDQEQTSRYIYGLRPTSAGYESTFVLRSGEASILRTYIPDDLTVRGLRIIFPADQTVALQNLTLISFGSPPSADRGVWVPNVPWKNSTNQPTSSGNTGMACDDGITTVELDRISSLQATDFPLEELTRLNVATSGCTVPLLILRRATSVRTVIFSNGAVDLKRSNRAPVFQRSTWWKLVHGHQIFVCDPGTVGPDAVGLGWGHLSQDYWAIPDISVAVRSLATVLGSSEPEQRLYFGSSGGGYMSVGLCHYDPRSRAVVNNAQFDWTLWMTGAVNALRAARFDNLAPGDIRHNWPTTTSVLRLLQTGSVSARIDYLVNLASKHDSAVELPLMERFIKNNPEIASNIRVFKYRNQASGHNPLYKDVAIACINGDVADVTLPDA